MLREEIFKKSNELMALLCIILKYMGLDSRKTCLRGFANNKGTDQPAHPRSLISAFIIHLSESIISKLATSEILLFFLVSVAEQAGLGMIWSDTPKTGFLASRPIWHRSR